MDCGYVFDFDDIRDAMNPHCMYMYMYIASLYLYSKNQKMNPEHYFKCACAKSVPTTIRPSFHLPSPFVVK
jgi:hypothetical protein